ncbi:MAG: Ig-like domain-containing protein, partial [Firmicutes bacterium]|nr:Ig-like domain-containing protein [Bacillota bacterium]
AVATVDTLGMVRAVTAGTAVITARSTFNTAVTAQTTITVTQALAPVITGVTISGATSPLTIPYPIPAVASRPSVQLTATVQGQNSPPQSVTWTSSNTNVATVTAQGLVRAVSAGTVSITARSTANTAISQSVSITVNQTVGDSLPVEVLPPLPTSITILANGGTRIYIGDSLQLSINVLPANATRDVVWSSSNVGVATVSDNGLITAVGAGSVIISVMSVDNRGLATGVVATLNLELEECAYYGGDYNCDDYVGGATDSDTAGNNVTNHAVWDNHGFRMLLAVMFLLMTTSLAYHIISGFVRGGIAGYKNARKYRGR